MHIDKISVFIKKLRDEKGLTQEQLAEMIPISRQAVSKWERGLAIPDSSVLIRLSEIFSVTINEILSGEKINKTNEKEVNQISLTLFDDAKKKKKIIRILSLILIVFTFAFLVYYFVISYRSIKVYTVSGMGDNISLSNGIFVRTNEKLFFRIGDFDILNENYKIKSLSLYYIDENDKKVVIASKDDDSILFIDYYGYNEYLDSSKIDYIIKNTYIEITFDDAKEKFKLNFDENYVNDFFITKRNRNITIKNDKKINYELNFEDIEIINKIKTNYKLIDSNYVYTIDDKDYKKTISYNDEANLIIMTIDTNAEKEIEKYIYKIDSKILMYNNYNNNEFYLFRDGKINCENCNDQKSKNIFNNFFHDISLTLN